MDFRASRLKTREIPIYGGGCEMSEQLNNVGGGNIIFCERARGGGAKQTAHTGERGVSSSSIGQI